MVSQAERRTATRRAILEAALNLFAGQGFAATTVDQIAADAGLAKGAIYHHFKSKEALFEAVFEAASAELAERVGAASATGGDVLESMVIGSRAYFAFCAEPPTRRIILQDGPAVLGWERWREIDTEHFGAMMPLVLEAAMSRGLIARQPTEPLARLLIGAVTEAAVACATSDDPARTGAEHVAALETLIGGLRLVKS